MRRARLGHRTYEDYLDSPHWQGLRLRYAAGGRPKRCAVCRHPAYELHHRTYRRLGSERLDDLVPLRHRHHETIHQSGLSLWDGYRVLRQRERTGPMLDCDHDSSAATPFQAPHPRQERPLEEDAVALAAELNAETEHEAEIEEGAKSQYDVLANGELIFSKRQEGRFPEHAEIHELLA